MPPFVLVLAQQQSELTGLAGWTVDVIRSLGLVGVGALTLLENLFPPIPSEVVLPLAGYLAQQGDLAFAAVVVAATLGSVAGAILLYWAGRAWGEERVDRLLERMPLVSEDDVEKAQDWFRRHGQLTVFIGRFVPGVRSLVSLPAGFQAMPLGRFLALTTIGTIGWNVLLAGAGYLLGQQWRTIGEYSDYINYAIYVALAVMVVKFVWRRRDRLPFTEPAEAPRPGS